MKDIILVAVILIILGCAGLYLYKAKKSGRACVGCPHSKGCGKCSCAHDKNE